MKDGRNHKITMVIKTTVIASMLVMASACSCIAAPESVSAFPGAEGFGKYTLGGRGGDVYCVTNLNDAGPGSLRHGIETAKGPRTIVFEVAGTIQLKRPLAIEKKSHLTIAGQTAPGKGITLRDQNVYIKHSKHIAVRYLRVRLGDENKKQDASPDVMTVDYNDQVILDHLSLSWGVDGNSDYRGNKNMTLQWLIYSEALNRSLHHKGEHAMASSLRDCLGHTTVHHTIYSTSRNRHPTLGSGVKKGGTDWIVDFRNCINYNYSGRTNLGGLQINVINNYYRPGPCTSNRSQPPLRMKDSDTTRARGFARGNYFDGMPETFNRDNFTAIEYTNTGNYMSTTREQWELKKAIDCGEFAIPTQSAEDAYTSCLKYAGCSLLRDTVDERSIANIVTQTGELIDSQDQVGGWDTYPMQHRPKNWDSDHDGMPNAWETSKGLNPKNADDRNQDRDGDGYTNLEEYLNSLCPDPLVRPLAGTQVNRPYRVLQEIPIQDIELADGFWQDRFELVKNVTIPRMFEYFHAENASHWRNFLIAAGLQEGKWQGTFWHDGDFYKWLESVVYVYQITGDKELDRLMDRIIEVIGKVQAPDGYLSTYIMLNNKARWQNKQHHELYNLGHLMTAASQHYQATGKTTFLAIGKKTGDYLYQTFCVDRPAHLNPFGFNPSNIMGAVDLYRATGDKCYLTLADTFISMRGTTKIGKTISHEEARQHSNPPGDDNNQDHVPFRQEKEAVGHAVTAGYLYCGAADAYMETGDKTLLAALDRIWDDVVRRKISIHGGVGPVPKGVSIRNDKVHEAFDLPYSLPNRIAYNETCANIANAMWNWRMLQIRPDAKYADVMEQVLYNSGLSGLGLDGDSFYYNNPLRRLGTDVPLAGWNEKYTRTKHIHCYCCPPQLARTQAKLRKYFYSLGTEEKVLWIHMYASNRLDTEFNDGTRMVLTQETDFPWDGRVDLKLNSTGNFALHLRIPGWAKDATVHVNGKTIQKVNPGTYLKIARLWKKGDSVQLDLPMNIQLIKANPLVEQLRNQIAVRRGPIVYCLESVDLPKSVNILDVTVNRNAETNAAFKPNLLSGVTAIELQGRYSHDTEWSVSPYNAPHLYKEIIPQVEKSLKLLLIPYYTWSNRGPSQMTVWLPYSR